MPNIVTVRQALNNALKDLLQNDEKVFIMGEEVAEYQGAYKITEGLLEQFGPKRVIDSPITEHGFAGLGVGAAMKGLRPIIEFMTFNFAMQAIDHIINSAAKTRYMSGGDLSVPIVFRGPNGSAARVAAQHSQCYASWYAHCPGLIVISAYDAYHSQELLKLACKNNNPVVFLEHELMYGKTFDLDNFKNVPVEIGKAYIAKEGKDITIVSFSWMMEKVHEAAKVLEEKHGISVEIIDLLTLRPLDKETIINSLKKTNKLMIVEEGWGYAGIGSEISSMLIDEAFCYLDNNIVRIHAKDVPLPYAENLEKAAIPTTEEIISKGKELAYK